MSNYRTCKLCHKKTKSYTNYCEDCFQKVVSKAIRSRKKRPAPLPYLCAENRLFDQFDLFMICTDDYIGVTIKQMAKLYMRSETLIEQKLSQCKKDGTYDRFIRFWQLKGAYDMFLKSDGKRKQYRT